MASACFTRRTRREREADEARLAPAAARSAESKGRAEPEAADDYRTAFERDRDRILHSKAFRRLKHKTQVVLNPEGDHVVTRLTHALQVTQVARSLAASLSLNETLAEAIALGHDVGHAPFGHTGEEALSAYFDSGWHHAAQGVRLYERLEPLNLSWEVLDGIRAHTWRVEPPPATAEGWCVRFADRIAYLSHDALDAISGGVLTAADLPAAVRGCLGRPGSQWVDRMVRALVDHSIDVGRVAMRPDVLACMDELRAFMFERVYAASDRAGARVRACEVLRGLVDHHLAHPERLPRRFREDGDCRVRQVVDFVSGMTDRYATSLYERLERAAPASGARR